MLLCPTLSIKIILSYKLALELLISELQSLLSLSQHHAALAQTALALMCLALSQHHAPLALSCALL